jgi:hypothetical protein
VYSISLKEEILYLENQFLNILLLNKIFYVKIILLTFLFSVFNSCNDSSDNNSNDGPPSEFQVTVNTTSYNSVNLTWSESFDPEDETVTYSVFLDGEQYANNLSLREFNFNDLLISIFYEGYVIATDPNNNQRIADFSFTTSENLPPSDFEVSSVDATNISLDINWTNSIDPEGENVTYDLYINDELLTSNYTELNFQFVNLNAATIYSIKINAKDPSGNVTTLNFDQSTLDGIYQGDVSMRTQAAVDSFGALGYIEITGDLEMDALAVFTDIVDLSPLNSLKTVRGYFTINFIDNLTSLSGLGIEHVGQSFRITHNDALLNLNGLDSLVEVLGAFQIDQNSNLVDVSGINSLTTIGEYLSINNNINLTNVSGFNTLNSVDTLWIQANWSLTQINAFSNVTSLIGDLNITNNTALTSIYGLSNVESIGRVFIKNTLIPNLDTLSSLSVVGGDLDIQNNTALSSVLGLSSLTEITYGNLSFFNNTSLSSLDGLENLKAVGNTVNFVGNSNLFDFCALQNLMQTFSPSSSPSISDNQFNPSITDIANGNCSN